MLARIPRKHRTLIFTLLGLVLVFFMLYVFDLYRLDEQGVMTQPVEDPPAATGH